MKIKELFKQFARSPTRIKLAIMAVILIWLIPFVAIIAGLIFYWEQQGEAQQPTPGGVTATIVLEPATGSPGTSVTIHGEGWPADSIVLIYLMAPDEGQLPAYAVAGATADTTGHFTTGFVFPAEPRWEGQEGAMVIARTPDDSISAQANFELALPEGWLPATSIPPLAPTAIATPTETEEPTVTVEPTPLPTLVIPTPTQTPQPAPPSVTANTNLNIRSGPGVAYPVIGLLPTGQTAEVSGVSPDAGWWQIKFPGLPGGYGWVSARYVSAQNVMNVPVAQAPPLPVAPPPIPTPPPTPVPTPVIVDWRGEYYHNRDLAGVPVLVRNDGAIDFNWGAGSPAAGLPSDNFSVRWTRSWNFSEGTHRFHVLVDDGVRLFVDEAMVIDSWQDGGWREVMGERWLWAGQHSLRVEYYEHSGAALIRAWAEQISPEGRPEARFDADHRSGRVPLRVEFDNESRGHYDRCEWDFGDDHDSDDCDDPDHTYKAAGEYTVRLKVSGPGGGDTEKKEDYVTVRPVAQFIANPTSGLRPLTVNFINQSSEHELSQWSFGDGVTSTEENPTHTYPAAGVYGVSLQIKEAGVWSDPETKVNYIIVTEPPPVAAFTANPTNGQVPLNVQFTDQSSGVITAWAWNFGDGTSSTEQSPTHTYMAAGVYTVSLTVTGPGGSHTETKVSSIAVIAPPVPVAAFTANPTNGQVPLNVQFTDQSSGVITAWAWDFGDRTGSPEQSPAHTYTAAGNYTVSLTVTGPGGSDTETKANYITITAPPAPTAKFSANPTSGQFPLNVQFTDNSEGDITAWSWDFGDGTGSPEQSPAHTYTAAGNYTVSLTVTGPGGSDTKTKPDLITVTAPPSLKAEFDAERTTGQAPFTVQFNEKSEGEYDSCLWDFGDGNTSTEENPSHTYQNAGLYTVSLTVTGPGGSDTKTKPNFITVTEPPTPELPTPPPAPFIPIPEPSPTELPAPAPQPSTPTPEPPTPAPTPEPPTATPEPPTPTPEPPTATPEPPTPIPEPPMPTPEPPTATPEPPTPTPEPLVPTPESPTPPLMPLSTPMIMSQSDSSQRQVEWGEFYEGK